MVKIAETESIDDLFQHYAVIEEVIQELNEWTDGQKEKYFDIMVMQEVQRRKGVDFIDFWFKKGKKLKEAVQETRGRNPAFFERGSKDYLGLLKYGYETGKGYFLSDSGKAYLASFEERTKKVENDMKNAGAIENCRKILQTARLTPAEYFIGRESVSPRSLFYGESPQIFKEGNLGEHVEGLLEKSRRLCFIAGFITIADESGFSLSASSQIR